MVRSQRPSLFMSSNEVTSLTVPDDCLTKVHPLTLSPYHQVAPVNQKPSFTPSWLKSHVVHLLVPVEPKVLDHWCSPVSVWSSAPSVNHEEVQTRPCLNTLWCTRMPSADEGVPRSLMPVPAVYMTVL